MPFLKRLLQFRWTLSLLILCVFPFTIWGAVQAFRSISNRVEDWIPEDFQATQDFYRFFGMFGSDELLMISWEGCSLDDARIGAFRDALLEPVDLGAGPQSLFREVITGPDVLEVYKSGKPPLSRSEALERMSDWIVSHDHQLTCLIALVAITAEGDADRHAALAHVRATADRVPGLSAERIHVAGSTIEGVAIDEASLYGLLPLNLASFALCMLVMAICLRNLRAAFIVLVIALFNEQMSMALIYYGGTQMNSILLLTANLTFVLSISICIHLFNYYKDALRKCSPQEAPLEACRAAVQPTVLATITTSLGLLSLTVSRIKPTIQFGAYSAVALVVATGIALVYLALHFSIWPLRLPPRQAAGGDETDQRKWSRFLQGWVGWVRLLRWPVIVVTLILLAVGYLGVRRLRTAVGLRELLSPRNPVVQDYVWLEENIGPLTPVEMVFEMPKGDAREMLAQYRTVAAVHHALREKYAENAVISMATFVPDPPASGGSFREVVLAASIGRNLEARQAELAELGYLLPTPEHNYWRITMRCPAMVEIDYGELLREIRATIGTTLDALRDDSAGDADHADSKPAASLGRIPSDVIVCGAVPLVHEAQQQLLEDLIYSFILAFALVSLTLMMLFRSILCGLICMIPNILPSALVFGLMGWSGTAIEFGTILTASAALGIAVDDSLHFITWFRRKIGDGASIREAVLYSYRRCAAAMVQTTLICSLGLVVFTLSPFTPISHFGWCMFALLMMALVADLLVLPAILLSPLGRPFLPADLSKAPTTLRGFALRVAGLREFVIVLVINTLIAVWVFHGAKGLPLQGLYAYFGPMSILLPALTTFFGVFNGVNERRGGRVAPAWPAGARWLLDAVVASIACAGILWMAVNVVFRLLYVAFPTVLIPYWLAIGMIGVSAGILGYGLHSLAVIGSGWIGRDPDGKRDVPAE